jgi:hypothetical protein
MQTQSAPMGTLSDRGASLIGLLLTVAIVAGVAAGIPLLVGVGKGQSVSTLSTDGPRVVPPAISASSKSEAGSDLAAAAAAACMTNYQASAGFSSSSVASRCGSRLVMNLIGCPYRG